MRIGLVGYGHGGRFFHAPLIATLPGATFVGVVTRSPERRQQLNTDLPGVKAFDSIGQIVEAGVAALVISSHLSAANGLVLEAIELLDDEPQHLFIESPMQIGVPGTFHDLAALINGLAGLPRIVTVHNLALNHVDPSLLRLNLVAKTYRYNPQAGDDLRESSQALAETKPQQPVDYDFASLRDPFQPPSGQFVRPVGRPAA